MAKNKFFVPPNMPLRHPDHPKPRTRREFIAQGFSAGIGAVAGTSMLTSALLSSKAQGQTLQDLEDYISLRSNSENCNLDGGSNLKIPFICVDLAGGANMAGSNVLIGGPGGQEDFISTAGFNKQGLPGDMVPGQGASVPLPGLGGVSSSRTDFVDDRLGLLFHSDSAFLRGMLEHLSDEAVNGIDGAVIPARSENDTGNNPHNPMYGIAQVANAKGGLLSLIGSRNSASGGNSMAPSDLILPDLQPTKIDRPSDVTGLVSVGDFGNLSSEEIVAVMATMSKISDAKLGRVDPRMASSLESDAILDTASCAYVEMSKGTVDFPPDRIDELLDPLQDPDIAGNADSIFSDDDLTGDGRREYLKAASVMKLVIDGPEGNPSGGYAGAGTISMGGYDYHGGGRSTGEVRDFRAGKVMGACLEYAQRKNRPLMLYVFSDGSLSSNGQTEDTDLGRGKGMWTSDNQQTGAAFFLVYNPGGKPQLVSAGPGRQIGHMRASGDVDTLSSPGANNVNQLVQMVILNYMALHGEQGDFAASYSSVSENLGIDPSTIDDLVAFQPIVNGTIDNPV